MNPMFNFLLALTAVSAATTANALEPVFDVEGAPLMSGIRYYVRPVNFVQGGGLSLLGRDGEQCQLDVVLSPEADRGFPVKFSNWRPKIAFVPESQNLNIETIAFTICIKSTYWSLGKGFFVTTGPKPEGDSQKSSFQIKKAYELGGFAYKFAFCPIGYPCTDVGVSGRHLGLKNDEPLVVEFVKEEESSSKTMSII